MADTENGDKLSEKHEISNKKYRKKVRRVKKTIRRIDILAQPKSVKQETDHKKQSPNNVARPVHTATKTLKLSPKSSRKRLTYPRGTSKMKKLSKPGKISGKQGGNTKESAPIVLPKKIGARLLSLVKKRLEEVKEVDGNSAKKN